jgi:hypothetical protein
MSWQFETNEMEGHEYRRDEDEALCSVARDFSIISSCAQSTTFHAAGYIIVYLANCILGGHWNNFRPRSYQTVVMNTIHCCHSSLRDTGMNIPDSGLQQRFPSLKQLYKDISPVSM